MEGKFTVSFTDGFNYLHVHNNTGVDGTADGSPATIYKAPTSVSLFYFDGNYITYTV
jgi:hypothetical protein